MSDHTEDLKTRGHLDRRSAACDSAGAADSAAARHRAVSEFLHAAGGGPRELRPADRRCDCRRQADRRVHAARRRGRGAGAGRPLQRRHRDAHPQDVQAARRQPAADRPGAGAADARRGRRRRSPISGRGSRAANEDTNDADGSRSTRWRATSRRTSSRSSRCRRCCPTICRRWR